MAREVWWFVGRTAAGNLLWSRLTKRDGYEYYEVPVDEFWPAPNPVEPQRTARGGGVLQALLDRLLGVQAVADDYVLAGGKGAK